MRIGIRTLSGGVDVVAIIAAAALTAVDPRRVPVISLDPTVLAAPVETDPLTRELARCREIGITADSDPACKAAGAESRRRFFTYAPSSVPAEAK